ncbi:MAG: hypothetical protein QM758_10170, partial [Armatimonas sp.]
HMDRDMVNRTWIMTREGLECVDCTGLEQTLDDVRNGTFHVEVEEDEDENGVTSHKHVVIQKGDDGEIETENIKGKKTKKKIIIKDSKGEVRVKDVTAEPNKKITVKGPDGEVQTEDVKGPEKKIIIKKKIKDDAEKEESPKEEDDKNNQAVKKIRLFELIPV